MATKLRAELSEKNKYWIDKHRYYELKHFCLQYPMWKKAYNILDEMGTQINNYSEVPACTNVPSNLTEKYAIAKTLLANRIDIIEKTAYEADNEIGYYILRGVTEELSYNHLKTKLEIPCGKDMYYDRYRRFFWLLNKARQ
ncbi:MAG: hypothetical protein ACI4XM_01395 [Candidatus Coprovivens sp.]